MSSSFPCTKPKLDQSVFSLQSHQQGTPKKAVNQFGTTLQEASAIWFLERPKQPTRIFILATRPLAFYQAWGLVQCPPVPLWRNRLASGYCSNQRRRRHLVELLQLLSPQDFVCSLSWHWLETLVLCNSKNDLALTHLEVPSGYWDHRENCRAYVEWLQSQFQHSTIKDVHQLKQAHFREKSGWGFLNQAFVGSVTKALICVYPEHILHPWKFSRCHVSDILARLTRAVRLLGFHWKSTPLLVMAGQRTRIHLIRRLVRN